MGQYKTNFRDTLRLFQVTNGHTEPFHKKTVKGKKLLIIIMNFFLFLFLFLDGAQAGDWIYACLFVSVLVMIQMLHKNTAGHLLSKQTKK